MAHPELSFEQAPPIQVPYRFFLTAPWFGVAAGLLLMYFGKSALVTRWAPETLALTHLITTGFMLQAMCGALLQFIPVAAGGNVGHPRRIAWLVHPSLAAGTILLATGFLGGRPSVLLSALPLFALGGTVFVITLFGALRRIGVSSPTLVALKLALAGLTITLGLGILLATALGKGWALPLIEITAIHVTFGLGVWSLLLLLGVSLYVVPMFQLTPPYPGKFARRMPWAVVAVALISVLPLFSPVSWARTIDFAALGLLGLGAAYALVTIHLQMRRRRRLTDPAFWFFRGGMVAVPLAMILAATRVWVETEFDGRLLLSVGVLLLGAFVSVTNGMLYKIIPFINWLHLQRLIQRVAGLGSMPPNMRLMIPELQMQRQMLLHFAAWGSVLMAVWWPSLSHVAGALWAASSAWLGLNLFGGVRRYAGFRDRILAGASHHVS